MGSKAYPACIFFCVVMAASFLAMGRAELRAGHFARSRPCSIEKLLLSIRSGSTVNAPFAPLPSAELTARPSGLTTPMLRAREPLLTTEKLRSPATVTRQASPHSPRAKYFFTIHIRAGERVCWVGCAVHRAGERVDGAARIRRNRDRHWQRTTQARKSQHLEIAIGEPRA